MVELEDRIYKYWLPPFLKRLQRNRSAPPPRTALRESEKHHRASRLATALCEVKLTTNGLTSDIR